MSLESDLQNAINQATNKWVQVTLGLAVKRCPVDEGTLRQSAVGVTHAAGNVTVGLLSFNTIYAAYQHEGLGFDHPKGGEPKYLESAVKDNASKLRGVLEKARDEVLASYGI
jgi:hypothetical protein